MTGALLLHKVHCESRRNAPGVHLLHMEPDDRVAAVVVIAPEAESNGNGGTLIQ
jgi:hypothetical protein